ncbi:hypothetical protein [Bosea sp. 685]|uniref:hypothetical protein n=1 Tax=Bosea sp. 685 TaxID=3080057 RepID=UPI0028937272|nr:hypothetical protein [Bosea sp. 685]WNJ91773.1 hypothetical protein RMR04_05555 [Bosea sp. 685]
MNKSNLIDFSQYVEIPALGTAWFNRDREPQDWHRFLMVEVGREGATVDDDGVEVKGTGRIRSLELRSGRWLLCLDARVSGPFTIDDMVAAVAGKPVVAGPPLRGNATVWLMAAAPTLAMLAIAGGLFGGLFKHFIAKPLGRLDGPTGALPEA